ncbi:hypothetical protein NADE_002787 [Nannochloris sp. 'desiccata']|nr:hypothetical protein NADE_002787 [Chlorella desiccata (nom. nud.)]
MPKNTGIQESKPVEGPFSGICGGKAALPAHGFNLPHAAAIPGLITSSLLILLQPGLQTGHGAVITGHVAIVDV